MTIRTARALLYSAIAVAPFVPLVWLTAAIVSDMLADRPARFRWASDLPAIQLSEAK